MKVFPFIPLLAKASAISLPGTLQCPGTQLNEIDLLDASSLILLRHSITVAVNEIVAVFKVTILKIMSVARDFSLFNEHVTFKARYAIICTHLERQKLNFENKQHLEYNVFSIPSDLYYPRYLGVLNFGLKNRG